MFEQLSCTVGEVTSSSTSAVLAACTFAVAQLCDGYVCFLVAAELTGERSLLN